MGAKNWQGHALLAALLLATGAVGQTVVGDPGAHAEVAAVQLIPEPAVAMGVDADAADSAGRPEEGTRFVSSEAQAGGARDPGVSLGGGEAWGEWYERPNLVRPLRMGATMLGGAAGGIVAGGGVFLVTAGIVCATSSLARSDGWFGGGSMCLLGPLMLGVVTGAIGVPVGIWLTGDLLNGDGNFWATLGGTAAGALVGSVTVSAMLKPGHNVHPVLTTVLMGVMPFLGGALLYELTSSTSASTERRRKSLELALLPNLSATRSGGLAPGLALGGRWD